MNKRRCCPVDRAEKPVALADVKQVAPPIPAKPFLKDRVLSFLAGPRPEDLTVEEWEELTGPDVKAFLRRWLAE